MNMQISKHPQGQCHLINIYGQTMTITNLLPLGYASLKKSSIVSVRAKLGNEGQILLNDFILGSEN